MSKQEQGFASYVQEEARKRNLQKEDVDSFVGRNWDRLTTLYSMRHGVLLLNDIERLRAHIRETY